MDTFKEFRLEREKMFYFLNVIICTLLLIFCMILHFWQLSL